MVEEEEGFSGGEEDEEDSGEWTEESEDEEQADHRVMLKPVFVPKNKRATIVQREELEEEEERVAEQETQRLLQRKEESKVLLAARYMLHSLPNHMPPPLLLSTHRRYSCYSQKNLPPDQRPRRALLPASRPTVKQQQWNSYLRQVQRRVRGRHHHRRRGSMNKAAFSKQKGIIRFIVLLYHQVDADGAFELWKIRELTRVKRDREEREKLVPAPESSTAPACHSRSMPCFRSATNRRSRGGAS